MKVCLWILKLFKPVLFVSLEDHSFTRALKFLSALA